MIIRKSSLALCSNSGLPVFFSSPQASITSSCSSSTSSVGNRNQCRPMKCSSRRRPQYYTGKTCCTRDYATVHDPPRKRSDSTGHHQWPASQHPTPYEIFDQQKHEPYSKAKFYQLVKIYHPDIHHATSGQVLSHTVRLNRYRLVVTANEILSDPVKRRAYDQYGAGWGGKLSMENLYRTADKSWRDVPGNPSMNATWEDWERWYGERGGEKRKQQPLYMSNELFVGVLCAFVLVGSLGQARRATAHTTNIMEMREQKHSAISQDMNKRRSEQAILDRHERVENFLRQRDGWNLASASVPESK
ncbi:hypothetical protein F4778DRAFT_671525 [Xylariomycetidae sp. FL2044]|nr:hypothetical protein F4778DRAFT_671525 [Xylariomycetidae sp. FL2044]